MIRYGAIFGLAAAVIATSDVMGQTVIVTAPMISDPVEKGPAPGAIDMRPNPATPARPAAKERPPAGNPLWAVPLKSLSITRDRPIFSPSRRPPPPPVLPVAYAAPAQPPPPKPAEPPPTLALVGTVVGDSESIGIFLDQATNAVVRLRTGQDHAGWILRSVGLREATFGKDQRTATFALPPPEGIASPPSPGIERAGQPTWVDGDGQIIAPPPARPTSPLSSAPSPTDQ